MQEMITTIANAARRSAAHADRTELKDADFSNALCCLRTPTNEMLCAGMEALIAPLGRKNALLVCTYIWQAMIKELLKNDVYGS